MKRNRTNSTDGADGAGTSKKRPRLSAKVAATMEQAERIRILFENSEDMAADPVTDTNEPAASTSSSSLSVTPRSHLTRLENMPTEILSRIFSHLTNPADFAVPQGKGKIVPYGFGRKKSVMIKKLYSLRRVCRSFRDFLDNSKFARDLPRPEIGLRITAKREFASSSKKIKAKDSDLSTIPHIIVNMYGGKGNSFPAKCVPITQLAETIRPCIVTSHLVVHGFTIDRYLLDALANIDTSLVGEVHFNDVLGIDLPEDDVTAQMKKLVASFPNAMDVSFLGLADKFDPEQVFPTKELEKELDLVRTDSSCDIVAISEEIQKYATCGKRRHSRSKRNNKRNRAIETLMNPITFRHYLESNRYRLKEHIRSLSFLGPDYVRQLLDTALARMQLEESQIEEFTAAINTLVLSDVPREKED